MYAIATEMQKASRSFLLFLSRAELLTIASDKTFCREHHAMAKISIQATVVFDYILDPSQAQAT